MNKSDTLHLIQPTSADGDFGCEESAADWYVLLWSQSQNAFHVERHRYMMDANRRAYAEDRRMDYVPLIVGSHDFCCGMADKLRNTLASRSIGRERAAVAIRKATGRDGDTCEGRPGS